MEFDFPWAQFLLVCGFFLVLVVEQAALQLGEQGSKEQHFPLQSVSSCQEEGSPLLGCQIPPCHQRGSQLPDHQIDQTPAPPHSHTSSFRSVLLVAALSLHSVFEGLAIGLQTSSAALLSLFLAVMAHKIVMAFSLSLTTAQCDLSGNTAQCSVLVELLLYVIFVHVQCEGCWCPTPCSAWPAQLGSCSGSPSPTCRPASARTSRVGSCRGSRAELSSLLPFLKFFHRNSISQENECIKFCLFSSDSVASVG